MQSELIRKALFAKFDQLNSTLSNLRSKTRGMKEDARTKWESQLAELESQSRAARFKLTEFSSDSPHAWETFKEGMESTWYSLKKSARKFEEEI